MSFEAGQAEASAVTTVEVEATRTDDEAPLVSNCEDHPDHVEVHCEEDENATPEVAVSGEGIVPYKSFEKLPTILPALFSMFSSLMMIASVFGVPFACLKDADTGGNGVGSGKPEPPHPDDNKCPVEAFSLLVYFHAFYWFIHLVIDPYLKKHHKKNRMKGYLEFYLDTKNIRRAPFYLVSFGNFGMLLVSTVLHDFCETFPDSCEHRFSKVDWLRGLITCEAMAVLLLFGYYAIKIRDFNRSGRFPDVMREKYMRALGCALVLKFPGADDEECSPEEETHVAGVNQMEIERMGLQEFVFGRTWQEDDEFVRLMQAEMIRFLITQVKRKNRKVVTLAKHLGRYTDDVQGLVSQGIEM